jgi:hypothetical protein
VNKSNYINYNNAIGFGEATLATGGAAVPFTAIIDVTLAVLPFVVSWATGFTAHPAADARDFIKNAKPKIATIEAAKRLASVILFSQKINPRAIDVNAREWLLWYRQNYPDDYKTLNPDAKIYWNNYINSVKQAYNNPNNMNVNLDQAMFTNEEINVNATPIKTASNIITNLTTGKTNWVLYGAIAIGAIFLIKNIKK